MKKKILAAILVVVLALVAIGSATLAYFNDTESATNTFTLGKVDIELNEYDHEGNEFEQNQKLLPGSSSANAIAKNAIVTVKDDSEDSWIWVEILIPEALYSSKTETNETNNALHINQFLDYLQEYDGRNSTNPNAVKCAEKYTPDWQWSILKYIKTTDDGYVLLRTTHKDIVKAGESTSPAISQVYMDNDVYYDAETGKYMIPKDGKAPDPATEFVAYNGDWEIIVNAYGVQAAGIADVDAAVAAYAAQGK